MKKWWSEYFYWNRTERKGVVALLLLMFTLMGGSIFLRLRAAEGEAVNDPAFLALAQQFDVADSTEESDERETYDRYPDRKYASENRKGSFSKAKFNSPAAPFNPNGLPKEEWVKLGLSDAQAQSVKRFEEKGGRFYRKEDLKKLYVISEEFYAHVEPFLLFPQEQKPDRREKQSTTGAEPVGRIDINRADSTQLAGLPGITPKMAVRMLKVRETFGGFHSLEQVKDLYGFYASGYEKLAAHAYAGSVTLKPLNLNYCTFKELMAVPGLNYDVVKAIMNYRERNGSFKKTDDLLTLNLAEPGLYAKIAPYLTVK